MSTDLSFALAPGEQVLFNTKSTKSFIGSRIRFYLIGLFLSAISIVLFQISEESIWLAVGCLCLGIILLYLTMLDAARTKNTYYQLTDKRAMVIETAVFGGKPTVFSFPLHADLIQHVKRHRNGKCDYLFALDANTLVSRGAIGFYNLPAEVFTDAQWESLGVAIPENNVAVKKLPKIQRPAGLRNVLGYLLGAIILGGLCHHMMMESGADLHVFGKEEKALIIGYEKGVEKRGKRKPVTIYYPVVIYKNGDANVQASALVGYSEPPPTGEYITVLADKQDAHRVIPAKGADEAVLTPAVFAISFLGLTACFVLSTIRVYRSRKLSFHEVQIKT